MRGRNVAAAFEEMKELMKKKGKTLEARAEDVFLLMGRHGVLDPDREARTKQLSRVRTHTNRARKRRA